MIEEVLNNLSFQEERILSADLLKDLKPLNEEGAFADYQKRTTIALLYKKVGQARHLLKAIAAGLNSLEPAARSSFEGLTTWLGYIILQDMTVTELEIFFRQSNITMIFQEELFCDLAEAVRSRLSNEYDSDARDALRERIYNALHNNESTLSAKNLAGDKRGSIGYWLKAYDAEVGPGRVEAFERVTFESKPEVQSNLTRDEVVTLRRLLNFYEWLKQPSDSLLGFEEDALFELPNSRYLLTNGILIDLSEDKAKPETKPEAEPEAKIETLSVKQLPPFQTVVGEAKKLLVDTQGQSRAVLAGLNKALSEQRATEALGALLLLAQLRRLDDVLSDDERFRELVREDLKKRGQDDKVEGLRLNPTAPNFIARLLKVALQDKLGLAPEEALGFARKLAGLLALEGEKYSRIAVEDGKGGWKWNL